MFHLSNGTSDEQARSKEMKRFQMTCQVNTKSIDTIPNDIHKLKSKSKAKV